jgi:hypothetical protein
MVSHRSEVVASLVLLACLNRAVLTGWGGFDRVSNYADGVFTCRK